ncbi:Pentatricopeptide repeat [Dillenia turbinata]|uniref:Pentatricopeptide repeat n=1 Tax=Dillenia turbinata TaxID=194707 RepID=A0AAN8WF44_9MAGN
MIEEKPEQTRSHVPKTDTKAIDFIHLMEQRGIRSNSQTYLWLLDCCFNSGSLLDAKRLQARILKSGFAAQPSLCSLLVHIYVSRGDLDGATKVFDDMPVKHVCFWNNIISRLSAKNLTAPVLVFFSRMLAENVVPDEPTFAAVLRAFTNGNVSLLWVEQIHAKIFRLGVSTSTVVCNPLIELYSKNRFVESAKRVFEKLCLRDNVSWVAMISGFSQNGCEEEAILLFRELIKSGTMPTPYVFSGIISACTKIELFELGEQLHSLIFKWGFSSEIFVCNALVSFYMRWGSLTSAEKVFNNMLCRDIVSYNSIISGLALHRISGRALQLFKNMQLDGLKPDCVTVTSLLSASGSVGALVLGLQLHSYAIKAGFSSDIIIEGSLLDLYVKCSDIDTANKFFLATETKNVVLWNVMLVAFGQMGDLVASVDIFSKMQIKGLRPNQYTYPSILRTCTSLGALELGEQIHSQVIKTGFQPNIYVSSVLIDMYAKHGRLDTSEEILRRLSEEDVVSWTAMIAGYAQHDLCVEALKTFEEMQIRGIRSDNVGFASAISACAGIKALNQGRQIHAQSVISGYTEDLSIGNALVSLYARCAKVNDAYLAFDKIDSKDNISWNGLISGFAQSGHCEEALQVFSQMNQAGIEVNLFTFASAVSAAANIANIKEGKQIHAMMIKTGNDMETEPSNVLITLYSKCGSIDDAKKEFSEMPEKNEVEDERIPSLALLFAPPCVLSR